MVKLQVQRLDEQPTVSAADLPRTKYDGPIHYATPHLQPLEASKHLDLFSSGGCVPTPCIPVQVVAAKVVTDAAPGDTSSLLPTVTAGAWLKPFLRDRAIMDAALDAVAQAAQGHALNPRAEWIRVVATGVSMLHVPGRRNLEACRRDPASLGCECNTQLQLSLIHI